jgi:hypothetical protein
MISWKPFRRMVLSTLADRPVTVGILPALDSPGSAGILPAFLSTKKLGRFPVPTFISILES